MSEGWLYFAIGLTGGILGGMGMGGGTLFIPLITIFMNVEQVTAQAVNLIAFVPMALVTLIIHIKNKLVDFNSVWYLLPSLITTVITSFYAVDIKSEILKKCFGIFLIIIAVAMFVSEGYKFFKNRKGRKANKNLTNIKL